MRMASSLLTSLLLLTLPPTLSSDFSPTVYHYLDCGSSTTTTFQDDNPVRYFIPDSTYLTSSSASKPLSIVTATSSSPYSSARLFTASTSYQLPTQVQGTYVLRLHFFPFSAQSYNLSSSNFSVSALNHFSLLANFSVPPASTAVLKEYLLSVDTSQFTLTFTPSGSFAFINAIELFTAPTTLIDSSNPKYVTASGNGSLVGQLSNQGLESLYRVNMGGPLVTPKNDTIWRTWVPDDPYVLDAYLSLKKSTNADSVRYEIQDPRQTPEVAPESIYSTARIMRVISNTNDPNFNLNLTWSFKVLPSKPYFIRMHFCNFLFPMSTFYFNVYIGQLVAFANFQPGMFTYGTSAAAFYKDFAANSDESGLMNISIGRSTRSIPTAASAMLNGLEIMKLGLDVEDGGEHNNGISKKILIPSVVGGFIVFTILILVVVLFLRRQRPTTDSEPKASSVPSWSPYKRGAHNSAYSQSSISIATPRVNLALQIPFEEIRLATDNFDDKLVIGSGGFGKVYKGVLRNGTKVAVKRGMPGSKQGYPEFQTEIEVLSGIRHRHLVSIIGYCDDQSEMILVYEYMEKGTLKNHLYGSNLPCLSWKERLQICIGAARGLHYLHTGYSHNIIHRDVKSTNILLGEDNLAKVADFGLSRVGPSLGETHVSTKVKGTFGYLDPEYFRIQQLTDKSDVYSFGVMLFEVLCARPAIDLNMESDELSLVEWALIWQRRGELVKIIDPRLQGTVNLNSLRKFGEIAEKCLADYGVNRPTIGDVLWNLEYALQLQETELKREAFEDSADVETDFLVNAVRRIPSTKRIDDDEVEMGKTTEVSSMVFSQLIGDGGK